MRWPACNVWDLLGNEGSEERPNAVGATSDNQICHNPVSKKPVQLHTDQVPETFRQIIESVNKTLKAQLDLERHGGRKPAGVCARILQRILALTAAIWHNQTNGAAGPARSRLAYDH